MGEQYIVDPETILRALSKARILVSMSEGPPRYLNSEGIAYRTMFIGPIYRVLKMSDEEFRRYIEQLFFSQLVSFVSSDGGDIIVEWRVWPEIEIDKVKARVYARLTSRPKTMTIN